MVTPLLLLLLLLQTLPSPCSTDGLLLRIVL